jgi:hypothetical protein
MMGDCRADADPTIAAGATNGVSKSSGWDWEISQFWQNLQRSGQPEVAKENASEPGRKC